MKDNKKMIFIIALIVIVLLICLLGIRQCEKQDKKSQDQDITNPSNDLDQPNNNTGDEDNTIDEVVAPTTTSNKETSKPTITLNGSDLVYVEINSTYEDDGAIASDQKYGDLTDKIVVNNPLDLSRLGTYIITYTITNEDGESAMITRTVIVRDTLSPVINYKEGVESGKIVYVDANRINAFSDHAVTAEDNSNGEITLEATYYYKAQLEDEYVEVDSLNPSILGYYQVSYVAIDESMNRSVDTLVVEYLVQDTKGPEIMVSMNGTEYPVVDLAVEIIAEDDYTDVTSFTYAWVTSLEEEPVWQESESGATISPENGNFYLLLKATDAFGNESTFTSELFQKDDTLMEVTNFNLHSGENYSGVNAGVRINQLTDMSEIETVVAKLYSGDTLLATNTTTDKIYELVLVDGSIELSTPFIVKEGTYVEEYWTMVQNNEYALNMKPDRVVFEITKTNGEIHTLENTSLVEPGIFWEGYFYDYDILVGLDHGNYQTIQEAVNNANDGAVILVLEGSYDGSLNITKNVTIYGLDRETTILTNTIDTNAIVNVNNRVVVTLRNLTLSGANTVSGSSIQDATVVMDNMIITHVLNAIDVEGQSNVNISNSHINNVIGKEETGYIDVSNQSVVNVSNTTIIATDEEDSIGIYYHGEDVSGTIENSVMINLDTAIAYDSQVPVTNNNTYVNCGNEVAIPSVEVTP